MFYFEVERLARDVVEVDGEWYIVDTCKTPDAGWETGIASIDLESMAEELDIDEEEGESLYPELIRKYAEDFIDEWGWEVQNYRTKRQAEAGHKRVCKNGKLDED